MGLERLRRGAALLNKLNSEGENTQLLVNDFRAGLVARELGVAEYVTIEGIQDIDAIAENGDSIIMDSDEDDHGRLVKYCQDFSKVWRFAQDNEDKVIHSEILISSETVMVDDTFFEQEEKVQKVLFFLGDADYNKTILNNETFFNAFDMELLLGNYFFVKYEDALAKLFTTLHEPEEYIDVIKHASIVVTASAQTAFEACATGAKVIYLALNDASLYDTEYIKKFGITVVEGFDVSSTKEALNHSTDKVIEVIKKIDSKTILQ
jgi:spore coat polysaccharide biosynthesis predicted glycosyltransferase SpsG